MHVEWVEKEPPVSFISSKPRTRVAGTLNAGNNAGYNASKDTVENAYPPRRKPTRHLCILEGGYVPTEKARRIQLLRTLHVQVPIIASLLDSALVLGAW